MKLFSIGEPLQSAEVVAVLKQCFPKMPAKASRKAFRAAVGLLGKDRFEFEVNRIRGWALDMRKNAEGTYEVTP